MHPTSEPDGLGGLDRATVGTVRRFARTATRRLAALDEHWRGRGRPLGQSRLLFELRGGPLRLGALRRRLGLDSGYASRLVAALADAGFVTVSPVPDDARSRVVELTATGEEEVRVLDDLSDRFAVSLVEGLDAPRRDRLVDAMATASRLLDAAAVEVVDVDPTDDDVRRAHAAYVAELVGRFPAGFDPGDPGEELPRYRPPGGACVLAVLDDDVVGTAALAPLAPRDEHDDAATPLGEVKRMWVADDARGLGIGRRLLGAIERRARDAGYVTLRLDTNEVLTTAIALYESAGYHPIRRYNDNPYATHFLERSLGG